MSKHKNLAAEGVAELRATNASESPSRSFLRLVHLPHLCSHIFAVVCRLHVSTSPPPPRIFARLSIATRTTFCPIKQAARLELVNKFWSSLPCLLKPIVVAREPLWPGLRITSKLLLVA